MKTSVSNLIDKFLSGGGKYIKVAHLDNSGIFNVVYIPRNRIENITYSDYENFLAMVYTHDVIYEFENIRDNNIHISTNGNLFINRPWNVFKRR